MIKIKKIMRGKKMDINLLNSISNWIVAIAGLGTILLLLLYVWEKVLFKIMKISRVHHKIFKYYKNKRDFEKWKKEKSDNN